MKTKEELQELAGLVRDVVSRLEIDFPANDHERALTDGYFRKAYAFLGKFEPVHLRRLHDALCRAKFLSPSGLGLRQTVGEQLARHQNLRDFRKVNLPLVMSPPPAVAKQP